MKSIREYVRDLSTAYAGVREVWLLGSRANGTARDDSDWDLLAFADEVTFHALRTDEKIQAEDVDLLVVYSATGQFEKPWGRKRKKGNLESWSWFQVSDREATYESHRWIPDENQKYPGTETGDWEDLQLKAVKLWPEP